MNILNKVLAGVLGLLPTLVGLAEEVHSGAKTGQLKKDFVVGSVQALLQGVGTVADVKEITPVVVGAAGAAVDGVVSLLTSLGVVNKGKNANP